MANLPFRIAAPPAPRDPLGRYTQPVAPDPVALRTQAERTGVNFTDTALAAVGADHPTPTGAQPRAAQNPWPAMARPLPFRLK